MNQKKLFECEARYNQKINALSQIVRNYGDRKSYLTLRKTTSNLFRKRKNDSTRSKVGLDVRKLNKVLEVDTNRGIVVAEGMTTYGDLIDACLQYNCMPAVAPQLMTITIGGALTGVGIESSSFRYGLVHETIESFDVLLSNGNIITCTADNEHKDLFFAFPNSYATFGYAVKVTAKIVPVKKYVRINHLHYRKTTDFFEHLKQYCLKNRHPNAQYSFVEGVSFDEKNHYVSIGEFVDEAPFASNYRYLKIYYRSISNNKIDYLTTRDYLHRWDTDYFWCSKHFYMQNRWARLLIGKWMLKSSSYNKMRRIADTNPLVKKLVKKAQCESVIQDIAIPISRADEFINFFHSKIKIKPIWICPTMAYNPEVTYDLFNTDGHQLYIDFGFWDVIPSSYQDGHYNRLIEKKTLELNGHKSLYSRSFYTEDEFWNIHPKQLYSKIKNKYDTARTLPSLYEKIYEK